MRGSWRVITFCLLTAVLPTILIVVPLYLRNLKYGDVMYKVSDSDVIQIHKGQSSIFCEKHSITMNTTFNAFQMKGKPQLSDKRRHIRLKKSMTLPDDTLEYWGFYLFKGALVELKACSRYEGSKILVVKGERILNTCGILEGPKYKKDPPTVRNEGSVVITLENPDTRHKNIPTSQTTNEDASEDDEWLDYTSNDMPESKKFVFHDRSDHENITLNKDLRNTSSTVKQRRKRNTNPPLHNPNTVLDAGVYHGGNAFNTTSNTPQDISVSSFENNLHECYQDHILINELFPYSILCNSTNYLEKTTILKVVHNILEDGYYYYIFYSDNDFVSNDINAIFDIFKPTFQYGNISDSKECINKTQCEFDVPFFSDEHVIVEVPTRHGFKNNDVDSSVLISVCHPRVAVYIIFPVAVLLLILIFAFL